MTLCGIREQIWQVVPCNQWLTGSMLGPYVDFAPVTLSSYPSSIVRWTKRAVATGNEDRKSRRLKRRKTIWRWRMVCIERMLR